jgi:hypothetical protein
MKEESMKLLFVMVALLFVIGCASPETERSAATTQPHAECLVCKYENDLACVDVTVEPDTPTTTYQGKSYYFCSDHCRNEFAKSPEKYVAQK